MANKKTRPTTEAEYNLIINTILTGFIAEDGECVRPNLRVATALVTECSVGLRINDILKLKLNDIRFENGKYKLKVIEQKTNKERTVYLTSDTYIYLQNYALSLGVQPTAKLFDLTARQVQKHLQKTTEYLKLNDIGTHSFRKMFATQLYYQNNCNALLIQKILNHSSIAITQRYLGLQEKEIEDALENYSMLPK
jgi:integrase